MLNFEKVHKQYGPQIILDNAELFVGPIDRVGLVGHNGAGKTTLLRMIMGQEEPDGGTISLDDWATVGMLAQESQCRLGITVREEMRSAFHEVDAAQEDIDALSEQLAYAEGHDQREKLRQLAQAQVTMEMQEAHTIDARIGRILHGLGFGDDAMDRLTDEFSGGWQMRIAMAKLLLREPALLMLDEPTNHLDAAALKWLQGYLEEYPGAVFVISHDSKFLDAVVTRIVELEDAKLNDYTGDYTHYVKVKEERREAQIAAYERQQRELARQQEFIDRFGAKATKATQVKSREKQLEKVELIEMPKEKRRSIVLQFPPAPRAAQEVMRLRGVSKSYNEQVVLLGIDIKFKRGDRIALLGPNGAGKSTLLRIIAGIENADEGEREVGRNVEIGYFAQHQAEALDPTRTVLEEALHGLENQSENVARGVLGRLLIRSDEVFKPVGVLSGGERARLALAKFLMRPANLLLLDEPTNHLDVASREVLKQSVAAFDGTVVVVSHDRSFVNAVATEAYTLEDGVLVEQRHSIVPPAKEGKKK